MSEQLEKTSNTPQEKAELQRVLEQFSDQQKANIVIQSFMVGAGTVEGHEYYVYFLSLKFNLRLTDAAQLLKKAFFSLPKKLQHEVIQAAYHRHLPQITSDVESRRSVLRKKESASVVLTLFEENLTFYLKDTDLDQLEDDVKLTISELPLDCTPAMDSLVVRTLRELAMKSGAYRDRAWYKDKISKNEDPLAN